MTIEIHLLGTPAVIRDGVPMPPPRGRKVWALLAYLVLVEHAPSRQELAELLFPESEDPLRSLRWNLTELRRVLGAGVTLTGDPVVLTVPPDTVIDVRAAASGTWTGAVEFSRLGHDLLGGLEPVGTPSFATWLLSERHRFRAVARRLLRDAVRDSLEAGEADAAVATAVRLVGLDPLDERSQALLVRSYVAAGNEVGARRQAAECATLFRRELGVEPGAVLRDALHGSSADTVLEHVTGRLAVETGLEAAHAALTGGLADAGLEALRRAFRDARATREVGLEMRAGLALGSGLVHAGRGAHHDGAELLSGVMVLAERIGAAPVLVSARTELAWAHIIDGRYATADEHLDRARETEVANGLAPSALIDLRRGWLLADTSRYEGSLRASTAAHDVAIATGHADVAAMALTVIGRVRLLQHDPEGARDALEAALEIDRREGLRSSATVPEKYLGTVALLDGAVGEAQQHLEHAYAVAHHAHDAVLEAGSQRGLALIEASTGDADAAIDRLVRARGLLARRHDYRWQSVWVLDSLCALAVGVRAPEAAGWVRDLVGLAGRIGAREFLARSYLHRHRLSGDDDALDSARRIVGDVDNPHLTYLLDAPVDPVELACA